MALRGAVAKETVTNKIAELFGDDTIGVFDKKLYVWANDGGQRVQVAITLTVPTKPIEVADSATLVNDSDVWDWSDKPKTAQNVTVTNAPVPDITEEETHNIQEMLARLGL